MSSQSSATRQSPANPTLVGERTVPIAGKRASRACQQCRQQKLRCLGGHPCERCVRLGKNCAFGQRSTARRRAGPSPGPEGSSPSARHHSQHESDVDMARPMTSSPTTESHPGVLNFPRTSITLSPQGSLPNSAQNIPPPLHTRPLEPPRVGYAIHPPSSAIEPHTRRDATGGQLDLAHQHSRARYLNGRARLERGPGARNIRASDSLYEAPFKSLLSESRRNSFDSSPPGAGTMRWNYTSSMFQTDDDPINTGILDQATAKSLFNFFVEHCHPFLPIINVALADTFAAVRQSASLFSAVLAVASRFYRKYNNLKASDGLPLEASCPQRLANLAEAHLGHTLLRRQLAQSDVQASLLLAAWSLQQDGTTGPDPWVVTGHAARMSRRLGVHKVLAHAAETSRQSQHGSSEWHFLELSMPSWRTWLCWFTFDGFLSLGFGRPQSTQFETVDESGFLKMRLEQCPLWPLSAGALSLNGDVYIASQVQLTQIARDLINWSEMLADPDQAVYSDPRRAETFTEKTLSWENMSKELNQRLDEWGKTWIWPNSSYGAYLGPSSRVARLQLEHLRLCLNAFAFTGGGDESEARERSLRSAVNAATSTVQIHHESSETDLGLGFATDYLTIALAQAAVFLIRASRSSQAALASIRMETAVLEHHISRAVRILQSDDLSETRLRRYLADQIQTTRHAFTDAHSRPPDDTGSNVAGNASQQQTPVGEATGGGDTLDFEAFFREQNVLDLASWLAPNSLSTSHNLGRMEMGGMSAYNGLQPDSSFPQPALPTASVLTTSQMLGPQMLGPGQNMALEDFDAFMGTGSGL